mgnify:CR=1 FL=1
MIRIVHIITGLGNGGAENMLYKLLKHSDTTKYYHEVISLMGERYYGEKLEALGVKVHCLHLPREKTHRRMLSSLLKVRTICRDFDVVDTWLYHADFFGFIVAKIMLKKTLIWNIRHSNLGEDVNNTRTLRIVRINSYLSRYVDGITYNSFRARDNHTEVGFLGRQSVVIPNGFELERFKYDPSARRRVRIELGLKDEKAIITVGRWDIQKDYYTLMAALYKLRKKYTNFKMIMVGTNLDWSNQELVELIKKYDLEENILLLGRRDDVPDLLSAADIYVSSSLGESFSNAIGEAMACELPCVVTDVGDSKLIVGETGIVVEAQDCEALATGLLSGMSRKDDRCSSARKRVVSNYDIISVAQRFRELWRLQEKRCNSQVRFIE